MERDAIQLIQDTAIAAHLQVVPDNLRQHVALLPGGGLVDLEQYQQGRRRYRGTYATQSLADFVAYAREHGASGTAAQGFVDIRDKLQAVMFFNLGDRSDPGHGDWRAVLALQQMAAFAALLAINGKSLSQRDVQTFIEDWPHAIAAVTVSDDGTRIAWPHSKLLAALRRLTINRASRTDTTEGAYSANASVLESVEASSEAGLPDLLTFTTVPYLDLPTRTFDLRLAISSADASEKPRLTLRVIELEAHKEAIAQQFKEALRKGLGEGFPLMVGAFAP